MRAQQRKQEQKDRMVETETRFDEKLFMLFGNDVLAPEDFARVYRTHLDSPERELMVAVLEQALADYQRYLSAREEKGMKRFGEAEAWILQTDAEWIFPFINCCEVLGIEPDYLRQGLLLWRQAKRPRLASVLATRRHKNPHKKLLRQAA